MADMDDEESGETAATWLGYAGLIPFVGTSALLWFSEQGFIGRQPFSRYPLWGLLGAYAAVILSFLGGIRWGVEVARPTGPRTKTLAVSVLPSLAGWALALMMWSPGPLYALSLLAVGLAAQGAWDIRARSLPPWFGRLRIVLSGGALLPLVNAVVWCLAQPHPFE